MKLNHTFKTGKRYVVALKVREESNLPYNYQTFDGKVLEIKDDFIQFIIFGRKEQEIYEEGTEKLIEKSEVDYEDITWHYLGNISSYSEIDISTPNVNAITRYTKPKNGNVMGFGLRDRQ